MCIRDREICNAVLDVWKPTPDNKVIINLPVTVSHSMPHVYASQVEYMCDHLNNRENVIVSLHPHNDRGCAVADSELGLLAGADRIEGTLFGNGERTGNVDIVTLAMNMYSQGVDPKLNFENMPEVVSTYEKMTNMKVYDRQDVYKRQLLTCSNSSLGSILSTSSIILPQRKTCYPHSFTYDTFHPAQSETPGKPAHTASPGLSDGEMS